MGTIREEIAMRTALLVLCLFAQDAEKIGVKRGIVAVVDPRTDAVALARTSELIVYAQSADASKVDAMRAAADNSGLLGTRFFAEQGAPGRIHLADNLADAVIATAETPRAEVLRVLRPGGKAFHGDEVR